MRNVLEVMNYASRCFFSSVQWCRVPCIACEGRTVQANRLQVLTNTPCWAIENTFLMTHSFAYRHLLTVSISIVTSNSSVSTASLPKRGSRIEQTLCCDTQTRNCNFTCNSSSNRLFADWTLSAMFAQPLHGTVLMKMMLTREDHNDFIRLVLTLTN